MSRSSSSFFFSMIDSFRISKLVVRKELSRRKTPLFLEEILRDLEEKTMPEICMIMITFIIWQHNLILE